MPSFRDVGRRRRRLRHAVTRGVSGTAFLTAAAVLMGLVQAAPATADVTPEEDLGFYRNSVGEDQRLDRCLVGVALHYGGANMKAKAIEGLKGSSEELYAVIGDRGWIGLGPLGQASDADKEAGLDYRDASNARTEALDAANTPYVQSAYASDDMMWDPPAFDADVRQFTLFTQEELAGRLGWEGHSNASAEAIARAKEITEANQDQNEWAENLAADDLLRDSAVNQKQYSGGTTASDIALYLKYGGFPKEAPAEGSAQYRILVEDLKQAWAGCDYQNPVDVRRVLNGPLMAAMTEWELEYASQAAPRATIIQAEADAAIATREATDDMIEAIGQAWLAEQILTWRKYWQDRLASDPDALSQPDQALYDQADTDLAAARDKAAVLVASAEQQAAAAATAAQKASTAQQEAWGIADADNVPRGRGLMYAQQSVQVARASSAAAEAAAKATRTALEAAKATVADSETLLAKAQTQSHAVNTEFRRIAAEEAAAQAKAAADTADAEAKAAADSADTAKAAQATAEQAGEEAHDAAATAQTQRATAELEKATAVASRVSAAAERAKAQEAEVQAATQQTAAEEAKSAATTAAGTAKDKRTAADVKAKDAATARTAATVALQKKQATAARAAALQAAATAAEGTEAAAETRAAADKARTAATDAATAATAAQTAADEAKAAAVSARSAATKAEAAAERAQASADEAWSSYLKATGAAADAHAAAATALDAAQDAALRADNAATASENATELAKKAAEESSAAGIEAASAVTTAATATGRAYAAGQAALAARDSAGQAIAAANDAVAIGTPYQEKDASAAFAVLVGQTSKTLAEQQAAAAEAKAAEAAEAAEAAQLAADQALGDAKLAAEAAAQAATDSVRATQAVARAQASAAEAQDAQQAAKKASESASGYAQQAGSDALSARNTAGEAGSESTQADREATEAERSAAQAEELASRAAGAASDAVNEATKAEQDAKDAEAKAAYADADSNAAEDAAAQAEQEQREQNEAEREDALQDGNTPIEGGSANWAVLGEQEKQILLDACGQTCVDAYEDALTAVSVDVVDWTAANGGQILLDEFGTAKVKQCLALDGTEDCLWSLVDIPSSAVIVGRIPALAEAIEKVSTGIRQIFLDAYGGRAKLVELTQLISETRSTPRRDQCIAGVALHVGGASMKAKAIEGLTGTAAELHAIVGDSGLIGLEPLGQASSEDRTAAFVYRDASAARTSGLEDANRPYARSSFSDEISLHAPEFDAAVLQFTLFTQEELAGRLGWDGHSNAGAEAVAQAKKITEENRGKDIWNDWAADEMLRDTAVNQTRFAGGTTASDIASYLSHGGFLSEAPAADSAEFRYEVENLKQAWSSCDHQDPVDPNNALGLVVSTATAEWNAEYASQAAPRAAILQAEADAAAATREATDDMVEAIGQAWLAEQILLWQKYWHDELKTNPDSLFKPKQALFDQANADLARARGKVQALATSAKQQATAASAAATRVVTAQQQAYDIADASDVPRGRGLSYAQQSVQVARASGAAATAAAKATETALNAANATVSTSQALLALAQTEAHAVNTEFRRIAAQEAAAQAKAAADSAEAYATSAANNAAIAKKAKEDAAREEEEARQAAADAQRTRAVAELERANAAAYRATAEHERDIAAGHEADAVAQGRIASDARASAEASGTVASDKRAVAEQAERGAVAARDDALEAEQRRDSLLAKAAALEAKADADEGTDAAEASRAAATGARSAADTATTAATNARASANAATAAAVNAREAATQAQGAASRARAAADATWASYLVAAGSAANAHVKAAEAIDASEAAAADAKGAKEESDKANTAAKTAKTEAAGARSEAQQTANWAAVTAGKAQAAVASALAARDSAAAVTRPAQEAIALGTPYQQEDSSAAFAVLTGQSSLTVAQQQVAAATATAGLAEEFSAEAKALAAQAAADMKLALEASAAAAADALRAAKAYQRAQASANQAAADAKAAQGSAERADGYAMSAGEDALAANWAANEAEQDAAAADNAATEAEHDAAHAREVATQAEADAAAARTTADEAEIDATAAEKAAEGARDAAQEAQDAADRTEKAENAQQISDGTVPDGADGSIGGVFYIVDHIEKVGDPQVVSKTDGCDGWIDNLFYNGDCTITSKIRYVAVLDLYLCTAQDLDPQKYTCPSAETTYIGQIRTDELSQTVTHTITIAEYQEGVDPIDILFGSWIKCAQKLTPGGQNGSVGGCAWAAVDVVSLFAGKIIRPIADALRAVDAAFITGVGVREAFAALKALDGVDTAAVAAIEREVAIYEDLKTGCLTNSFPATTEVVLADGRRKAIGDVRTGDLLLASDPATGATRGEAVTRTFQHGAAELVDVTLAEGGRLTSTPGHKVFVSGQGWILASDLRPGDTLSTPDGTRTVLTVKDRHEAAPRTVYDVTVSGLHTFYAVAGDSPVLVHNCNDLVFDGQKFPGLAHTLDEHTAGAAADGLVDAAEAARLANAKGVNSVFVDQETAQAVVDYALAKNATRIKNWLSKTRDPWLEFEGTFSGKTSLGTEYRAGGATAATGNRFYIKLVRVDKNVSGKHPMGFYVMTCYPK
ncbi:polymorphic toxin-type HINT domain-containing protein [Streptomyces sp. NBC_00554]|uniref:polymorphic toxin-type HINT domain-containing protein n=1 Tax=Streptomyces sp. NBC_00554 TaxID=2903661 RepID=UPI00352CD38B|nr:polymorphic toxin-type HINT domain-containing protein [Streptomyces sp. NBC_00554]